VTQSPPVAQFPLDEPDAALWVSAALVALLALLVGLLSSLWVLFVALCVLSAVLVVWSEPPPAWLDPESVAAGDDDELDAV
jgi:hypothetical protein